MNSACQFQFYGPGLTELVACDGSKADGELRSAQSAC